jgi:hypothetical protein
MGTKTIKVVNLATWKLRHIKELYQHDKADYDGFGTYTLIIRDKESGRAEKRYDVYRLNFSTGKLSQIGVELDILSARARARRSVKRDGTEITEEDVRIAKLSKKKYKKFHWKWTAIR